MGKVVESGNQDLLILGKPLDISIIPSNVPIEISDLRLLELDLLIQVNFLRTNDVELFDLVVHSQLSLSQSGVDLFELVLNLLDLILGVFDHLVAVLDLGLEVVCELRLFSLLKILLQQLLTMLDKL